MTFYMLFVRDYFTHCSEKPLKPEGVGSAVDPLHEFYLMFIRHFFNSFL